MDISAAQHQLLHHPYPLHLLHHHQEMMGGSHSDPQSLDSIIASSKPAAEQPQPQDKKPRPPDNEAQKCPRCESTNTKFCYYNNYSLSQPRYFCKSCRRYWTKGGTLRKVPVGGGCRKSSSSSSAKRPSSPSSATSSPSFSSSSFRRAHNHDVMMTPNPLLSSLHHQLSSSYGGGLGLGLGSDGMIANPNGVMFLNSLNNAGGGLFQNLCYGVGGGNSNSVCGISEDNMGAHLPFEEAVTTKTTMKQEGMGGDESKGMWGFPLQVNYGEVGSTAGVAVAAAGGGGGGGGDHLEPIRGGWNGLMGNSGWHGLLSTPAALM